MCVTAARAVGIASLWLSGCHGSVESRDEFDCPIFRLVVRAAAECRRYSSHARHAGYGSCHGTGLARWVAEMAVIDPVDP